MGQAPRVLQASASARHFFGAELRRLRVSRGLSQDQLGIRVHFSGDTIRRVETADRFARRELAEACDRELDAGGMLLRLWRLVECDRDTAGTHPLQSVPGHARRRHAGFVPSGLERVALDWLLDAGVSGAVTAARNSGRRRVDEGDVQRSAIAMRTFRDLDHTHGAGQVHGRVESYIAGELNPMLAGTAVTHHVAARLRTVAVGFFELSGYQAVDTGADGVAQRRYLRALWLSRAAEDRSYGGYLLGVNIGHLALHCDHPESALRMGLAAIRGAGDAASPAVRAALHAVVARAYAGLGHAAACLDEIGAAESLLGRSRPDDEPEWIRYFTPAYLADEMAHCFYDLGDYRLARRYVHDAIDGLEPWHVRRLAIDTALLASSLAAEGKVDEACAAGRRAVDHAANTTSYRCTERIGRMLRCLAPHRDERDVGELVDYVQVHQISGVTSSPWMTVS